MSIPKTTLRELMDRYEGLLFDAYGVLMDASGALTGAPEAIAELNRAGYPYLIVTNGSSRTLGDLESKYQSFGLDISIDKILSSGSLIAEWVATNRLVGKPVHVLGPEASYPLATSAGAAIWNRSRPANGELPAAIILADQSGITFPEDIDYVIDLICQAMEANRLPKLLCPNPDLFYPKSSGSFGLTIGSLATLIEGILKIRFPATAPSFHRLGKPFAPIFAAAVKKLGTDQVAMVGDMIQTDIVGANRFGIDSILIGTGITKLSEIDPASLPADHLPTYLLDKL